MKVLPSEEESTRTQHRPTTQHERKGKGGEREGRGRGEGGGEGKGGTGGEIGEGEGQRKEEGTGGRGRSSTYSDLSWETDNRLHKGQWEPKRQGALQRENGKEGRNSINMRKDIKYYQVHVWVWFDVLSACPQWWMYCIKRVVCTCTCIMDSGGENGVNYELRNEFVWYEHMYEWGNMYQCVCKYG